LRTAPSSFRRSASSSSRPGPRPCSCTKTQLSRAAALS
jgi:hypothetical protein